MAVTMNPDWDLRMTPEPGSTVKFVGTGRVAGYDVLRYLISTPLDNHPFDREISMAPGLSCEVMDVVHTSPGWLGVTKRKIHYRVTHHEIGEPEPTLLQLPLGYTVKPY
jgi:hypothetical protein